MSNTPEVVVRPVHRDEPDLHKLAEAMIRLVLEESRRTRVARRTLELPTTLRIPQPRIGDSEASDLAS